ncbi:putative polysaccharide biosynthesis protein [Salibacterium aidingense]|uniref:putative polysaccharide biosynthesis protein n=1 Tax=Salibacterium aidingense TaxID=384933 RepID=UPI003BBE5E77
MGTSYIKNKRFWKGAFFVTAAAFIGKVLSALYRVPFQNMAGDQGLYVYQQIYPIYGAAMILSMYGFPVILSKIIVENTVNTGEGAAKNTAYAAFISLILFHVFLFLLAFAGAPWIAGWMGDANLERLIRSISPALLLIPVFSVVRGYYQGIGEMRPTAVSHLLEQVIRVSAILTLTAFTVWMGKNAYAAGQAAAAGSVLGSIGGAVYLLGFWFWKEKAIRVSWGETLKRLKEIHGKMVIYGILTACGAMVFILYQLVDAFTAARVMAANGIDPDQAKNLKGVFDRGQPLLQFGTVLAATFSMTVVPMIQQEELTGTRETSRRYASLAIRLTWFIGTAAAIGLIIIAEPVNIMLFENEKGTGAMQILAVTLIFSGIIMVTGAILQGQNCFLWPAVLLLLGLTLKLTANLILIPLFDIHGAAAATVAGMAVTAAGNTWVIYHKKYAYFPGIAWLVRAGAALAGMGAVIFVLKYGCDSFMEFTRLSAAGTALSAAVLGVMLQVSAVIHLSLFTKEEGMLLPAGNKLVNRMERKEQNRENRAKRK